MKRIARQLVIGAVLLNLTGCGLYSKYESQSRVASDVYGVNALSMQSQGMASIGEIGWRDFFKDPFLQALIDTALVRNTDIKTARIRILQAESTLQAARLAYLPSVTFAPQGSISSFDGNVTKAYNIGATLQLPIDIFGNITSAKRRTQVLKAIAEEQEHLVTMQIVANVAQAYSKLQLLDSQLQIMRRTLDIWHQSLDMQRAMMDNGRAYSTSVNQMEASCLGVETQIIDIENSINSIEDAINLLLCRAPQSVSRKAQNNYPLPEQWGTGVPALMLTNRPDVRIAERGIEAAHYSIASARAAFYPNLTLNGALGWSNADGVVNPGKLLASAAASLIQPLFAQGKLKANLKNAKLDKEAAINQMEYTILKAGNEVNRALEDCQNAQRKTKVISRQVAALQKACDGTRELMRNGKATYIEVLTAQEALLNAQLSQAAITHDSTQSLIALYVALGGGVTEKSIH